jgi:restriction system protein
MPIPDYEKIMRPLLKFASDKKEHSLSEAIEHINEEFSLSEAEKREKLPSGQQSIIDNRIGWARTYLKKAGLLESTRRGYFRITDRGLEILKQNPLEISAKFLMQFAEFVEFQTVKKEHKDDSQTSIASSLDPVEMLERGYQKIESDLAQELLKEIRNKKDNSKFLEELVLKLLQGMGYGDLVEHMGRTGDGGVDGRIKQDKLGLDMIYIQAKNWENIVSRPEIQKFIGALDNKRAKKGIFITASGFSDEARESASNCHSATIVLVDGMELAKLMIEHNIGVAEDRSYNIKKKDSDFFTEE